MDNNDDRQEQTEMFLRLARLLAQAAVRIVRRKEQPEATEREE